MASNTIETQATNSSPSRRQDLEMESLPSHPSAAEEPQSANLTQPYPSDTALSQPSGSAATERRESEAIGPSSDSPNPKADPTGGPTILITLLLASGDRHPYKIDARYLKKRNVTVEDMDPYNLTVYTMKELIMRDWREEWEAKPSSPSYIRLIHFGRMLDDKSPLKECRFNPTTPNVVHMSIKPSESIEEEDPKHSGKAPSRRGSQGNSRAACCGCVIL